MLRPCCAEQMVLLGNSLISLVWCRNALKHETGPKNEVEIGEVVDLSA